MENQVITIKKKVRDAKTDAISIISALLIGGISSFISLQQLNELYVIHFQFGFFCFLESSLIKVLTVLVVALYCMLFIFSFLLNIQQLYLLIFDLKKEIIGLASIIKNLKEYHKSNPTFLKDAQIINCIKEIESEKDLQENLVEAIKSEKLWFDGQLLQLVEDGVEFRTKVGNIDILCMNEDNEYFVIELKRNDNSDKVVGQIMRYINAINLLTQNDKVTGIILSDKITNKLIYSYSSIPNLHLFKWSEFKNKTEIFIERVNRIS